MSRPDDYSPEVWAKIPSYDQAFKYVREHPLEASVFERIGSIFLTHKVEDSLALSLVHRHFGLAADERLVEYNGVGTPWRLDTSSMSAIRHRIFPKSWAFIDGQICPYEFGFEDNPATSIPHPTFKDAFLNDLQILLGELHLGGVLGLSLFTADDKMFNLGSGAVNGPQVEFTTARSNITIATTSDFDQNDLVETNWVFTRGDKGPRPLTCCFRCCSFHGN